MKFDKDNDVIFDEENNKEYEYNSSSESMSGDEGDNDFDPKEPNFKNSLGYQ